MKRENNNNRLAVCGVEFDEGLHTYTLGGRKLSGITGIIREKLFPDMLDGIPKSVLNKAAERGSELHSEIETLINEDVPVYSEGGRAFVEMFGNEITEGSLVGEYLVTDYERVASSIDIVRMNIDGTFDLFDIKTTAVLNTEYVMWQLSIYAYLFEMVNKGTMVKNLYALHIRDGEMKEVEVHRIETEHCRKLIDSYFNGEPFTNPLYPTAEKEELARIERAETSIIEMEKLINAAKERRDAMLSKLKEAMRENGIKKWETERMTLTYVASTFRKGIDTKKLREERPEIASVYETENEIGDSVRIRLKN